MFACSNNACGGVCVPGSHQCSDSTHLQTCDNSGQWGAATACMFACVNAACGGVCAPGAKQCATNTSKQVCGNDGQWAQATACPLAAPPNPACMNGNCAYHAGYDQQGSSTDQLFAGFLYAVRFTVSTTTKAYRLGMFGTATGRNVKMGIYSESALQPQTLVSQTSNVATANGVIEAPLAAPVTLNAGSNYWIAAIADADITMMHVHSGGAGYFGNNNPTGWPNLPSSFPAGGGLSTNETPDFYVVLEDP
jgi:hypothetical protein